MIPKRQDDVLHRNFFDLMSVREKRKTSFNEVLSVVGRFLFE